MLNLCRKKDRSGVLNICEVKINFWKITQGNAFIIGANNFKTGNRSLNKF